MIPSAAEPQLNRPLVPLIVLVLELVLVIEFWAEQTRPPQPFVDRFAVSTQALECEDECEDEYEYDYRNDCETETICANADLVRIEAKPYRSRRLRIVAAHIKARR